MKHGKRQASQRFRLAEKSRISHDRRKGKTVAIKQWLVLVAAVTVTVSLTLGIIRWQAPQLLGIPVDLQLVQVSKKVAPFFDGVFCVRERRHRADDRRRGNEREPRPTLHLTSSARARRFVAIIFAVLALSFASRRMSTP